MILTEKETNAIEDLKTQEQACIEKYTKYSNQAKDPVLKELFEDNQSSLGFANLF